MYSFILRLEKKYLLMLNFLLEAKNHVLDVNLQNNYEK